MPPKRGNGVKQRKPIRVEAQLLMALRIVDQLSSLPISDLLADIPGQKPVRNRRNRRGELAEAGRVTAGEKPMGHATSPNLSAVQQKCPVCREKRQIAPADAKPEVSIKHEDRLQVCRKTANRTIIGERRHNGVSTEKTRAKRKIRKWPEKTR